MLAEYVFRPQEWYVHHGRYSNSVIHRITLEERAVSFGKQYADVFAAQVAFIQNISPNDTIDCFPGLAKLPKALQWWRRKYEAIGESTFDA